MLIQKGYKVEIDPNNKQRTLLAKHAGTARYAYNWAIKEKQTAYANGDKYPNAIELHRKLNLLKKEEFPWMYEVSKCSPQEALRDCDVAFNRFFKKQARYPKRKTKKNGLGSFRLTGTIKVFDKYVQLPVLGRLRLKEADYIPIGKKILSATVSEKAGHWFVSVLVEEEIELPSKEENIIGIDLGIKTLATCSDGQTFDNPKHLKKSLDKIKKLQRQVSRKKIGSRNRKKAAMKLARQYRKVANQRKDTLHKITTTLTKTKSKAVVEDLNVSGMMKNHKLAFAIADVGFYEFRRQMEYKGKWYNCEIVLADRWFPSSKMCSCCGNIKKELSLAERIYICEVCGLEIDRDFNGSICLEHYEPNWKKHTVSSAEMSCCRKIQGTPLDDYGSGMIRDDRVKPFSMN